MCASHDLPTARPIEPMPAASTPDLFTPLRAGAFELSHRVVMPALSRHRADADGVPSARMAAHYGRRASAGGLIVCEATAVNAASCQPGAPGLHSAEQVNHWRQVTDAVHRGGGIVIAQLRLGAAAGGPAPPDPDSIERWLLDYRSAAENAGDAGFDGVELQAAQGALPERMLHEASAEDGPGMRFLAAALRSLIGVWGRERVGLCLSLQRPEPGRRSAGLDALAFYAQLLCDLQREGIAYLQLVEPGHDGLVTPPERAPQPRLASLLRPHYAGVLLVAGGHDAASARQALGSGQADAVAFGRAFIAHPDLPARLRAGLPLRRGSPRWYFAGGDRGYVDAAGG